MMEGCLYGGQRDCAPLGGQLMFSSVAYLGESARLKSVGMALEWEISDGQRVPASLLIASLFLFLLGPEVCVLWMAGPLRGSSPRPPPPPPWLGLVWFFSGLGSDFLHGQAASTMGYVSDVLGSFRASVGPPRGHPQACEEGGLGARTWVPRAEVQGAESQRCWEQVPSRQSALLAGAGALDVLSL